MPVLQEASDSGNNSADCEIEERGIRHPIEHNFGQCFGCVEDNVTPLLAGFVGADTTRHQPLVEPIAVRLGGNHDRGITASERRTDIVTQRFQERITFSIEINNMFVKLFFRMRDRRSVAGA